MTSRFTHRTDLTRAPSRTPRRLERRQLLCERMEPRRLMATMAEGFEPGASAADVIPGASKAEPAAIVCQGAQVAGDKLADCFMPVVDRTAEPEADLQPGPNKDLPSVPDGFLPVAIDLVDEYQRFVAQNPTWPEEHGAGDIQLMVITPSRHLPWIELGTPGEAQSFDAWYEQTYLDIVIDDPLAPSVDAAGTQDFGKPSSPDRHGPVRYPLIAASDPVAKTTRPASASRGDAAWATLFANYAGLESSGTTPLGGRRRSR